MSSKGDVKEVDTSASASGEEKKGSLSDALVIEKYKKAAEIANATIELVMKLATPSAKLNDICVAADKFIQEETQKIYNKQKDMEKGIAFPTCVSTNNTVGHFSPLSADTSVINAGDMVKVDCGVHIDGYVAVVGHTFFAGDEEITGKKADVYIAAHTAAEAAIRMLRAGKKNYEVSEIFHKISEDFKVNCVQGVLSHQVERFNLDGKKVILNRIDPEHKVEECEFAVDEIWSIDVVMSSGEGKPKETGDERTTIYKRTPDRTYQLKMQTSRAVFSEIIKKFPNFPFNIRELDQKTARFAIRECLQHELVTPYPVLHEKDEEFVAHFKFTALLTQHGPVKITGLVPNFSKVKSELKVENQDVLNVLALSAKPDNKKNKKKKN